ncbi:MAG: hypothetical protein ABIE07_12395 [Candidatus Zixiibacteriota bacterium]
MKKVPYYKTLLSEGIDLTKNVSSLTGLSYENTYHKINLLDPPLTDGLGHISIDYYKDFARSYGASDHTIAKSLTNITGLGYENILIQVKMPKIDY